MRYKLILLGIISAGVTLRLVFIDYGSDLGGDARLYLGYANNFAFFEEIPKNPVPLHNIGWPVFLSWFIRFFEYDIVLLSNVQRIMTVILSTATIPIIYLVARQFFKRSYALVGAGLFAFDWRIIQNSTFGITEPLFLLLSFGSFFAILKNCRKWSILSLALAGCAMTVRIEGILMFVVVTMIYLTKYRPSTKKLMLYGAMIQIIFVPVLVAILVNLGLGNPDGFLSKAEHEIWVFNDVVTKYRYDELANSLVYMGWSTFPNYFFLIPFGLYAIIVRKRFNLLILASLAVLLSSGIWAYVDAYDTRYFFQSYIILVLVSLAGLEFIVPRVRARITQLVDDLRKAQL